MNQETIQDYLWLVTPEASGLLEESQTAILDRINILTIVKRLRKEITPARAALVTELAQVRLKARKKFAQADRMFFTRKGYEQSSGELISHYKSLAFDGMPLVADVCCGIGGDLLGIGSRNGNGDTHGFDTQFLCSLFAEKNIESNMIPNVKVLQKPFSDVTLEDYDAVHIDPDRRKQGRTTQGHFFEPTLDEVYEKMHRNPNWCIKVAPATAAPLWLNKGCWVEWVGDSRECKQQIIWTGDLAQHPGAKTATHIFPDGSSEHFTNDPDEPHPTAEASIRIRGFIYEPHPTIVAAGLTDNLAAEFGLMKISQNVNYLTSTDCVKVPLTSLFEVEEVLPFSLRHVGTKLRSMGVGQLEIKTRNIRSHEAEQFGKLKLEGDKPAVLFLTRLAQKRIAIVARRTEPDIV